jgi:gas vesicle protein
MVSMQGADNHILHLTVSRRCTMSDQGRQAAKVAALMAGGAVIGAGIGLLFAPQTGAETRRDVGRYAKKAPVQATRWSRTVRSGVKEAMDRRKAVTQKDEQKPLIEAV